MPSLWFVVPVHGRLPLAAICLRQLRRTCDSLAEHDIEATAVIVADRQNLRELGRRLGRSGTLPMLGFATVERDNQFLSRKFNDGIQLATDQRYNKRPADYVVPCGSDDWVDYRILLDLPAEHTVLGFKRMSFVREDGREISASYVDYPGGSGIRVYPRRLLTRLRYRPADEDRKRACDTSILTNVRLANERRGITIAHGDVHDRQIVDWKTAGVQVNSYAGVRQWTKGVAADPFVELEGVYPAESLREMQNHYARIAGRTLVAA